jgi:prophage maintenance system killer protein
MRYLSVHDLLWVNQCVIGTTPAFEYEKLEACVAAQYGYGASREPSEHAECFLAALLTQRPFAAGNRRAALAATATFLVANGMALLPQDVDTLRGLLTEFDGARACAGDLVSALVGRPAEGATGDARGLRVIVTAVVRGLAPVLETLAADDRSPLS